MASTQPHSPGRTARFAAGVVAAAFVLVGAAAVVLGLSSPAAASNHAVMIEQYAYSPAALTVEQGDTVTWTNHDSVQHDVLVTSGPATFQSPMLGQGQSWSHTFTVAGSYSYICSVHPDMRGSVTARAKATAAPKPAQTKKAAPAPAAAPQTAEPSSASRGGTRTAKTPSPAPAAAEAPAATQALTATPVAASTSTLDPLLLVAGASTAVMVFCLLLMTSRPVVKPAEPVEATDTD
jgi:plastocyanin